MSRILRPLQKHVTLTGLTEIMFARYPGDNNTKLSPDQKFYLNSQNEICLPTINLISFLTAINTESAPIVCLGKQAKRVASALLCSVTISPSPLIPFTRDGQPIVFGEFNERDIDERSGAYVFHSKAIVKKGAAAIPNPVSRPVLPRPWTLSFDIQVLPHPDLTEDLVANLFHDGGTRLGLGTFRKMFGKFSMEWR